MLIRKCLVGLVAVVLVLCIGQASAAVHTSDFIDDADRTHFNGFENIPMGDYYHYANNGSVPYVEDGIQVQQVVRVHSGNDRAGWNGVMPCGGRRVDGVGGGLG